jgi:hypothetical protein
MKVLAFDQATVTGWCIGGDKIPLPQWVTGHFKTPKRDVVGERLVIAADTIGQLMDDHLPDLVVWETRFDPSLVERRGEASPWKTNAATRDFLCKIEGLLEEATARRGIMSEHYGSRTWRATLKLPALSAQQWDAWGGLTPSQVQSRRTKWIKDETMKAIRRLGGKVGTTDEADAWGIAFHSLHGQAGIKRATADLFERAKATL